LSAPLQTAVFDLLKSNAGVTALVGALVFDALPTGVRPETFVLIGEEEVLDASDSSGHAATHRFVVSVVTEAAGYSLIKSVAAAISDALLSVDLVLSRGQVVNLSFERATARRSGKAGRMRRVDLRFRARLEDS
jgi:hypothetical protein